MRFVVMVLCILAIASAQANAQGTLRPSQCPQGQGLKATLMVAGDTAPPFRVVLSTVDPSYQNARWHLVPVGDQFGIVSFLTQYGSVAITSTGNGAAVVASPWNGNAQQLWRVTNDGQSSTFALGSSGLYMRTGDQCRRGQPLVLAPDSGPVIWIWN